MSNSRSASSSKHYWPPEDKLEHTSPHKVCEVAIPPLTHDEKSANVCGRIHVSKAKRCQILLNSQIYFSKTAKDKPNGSTIPWTASGPSYRAWSAEQL